MLDASSVEAAVAGQDAALSALGTRSTKPTTLFSESTHNLISAMNKHGVRRLICITGIGVGDSKGHVGFLYDRIIRPFVVKNVYEDKERQEEAIKQSDLDWVIVRPARLTDEPAKGKYNVFSRGFVHGDEDIACGCCGLYARAADRRHIRAQDARDQLLSIRIVNDADCFSIGFFLLALTRGLYKALFTDRKGPLPTTTTGIARLSTAWK